MRLLLIQLSQIIRGEKTPKDPKIILARMNLANPNSLTPSEFQFDIVKYFENVPCGDPADFIGNNFLISQLLPPTKLSMYAQ